MLPWYIIWHMPMTFVHIYAHALLVLVTVFRSIQTACVVANAGRVQGKVSSQETARWESKSGRTVTHTGSDRSTRKLGSERHGNIIRHYWRLP